MGVDAEEFNRGRCTWLLLLLSPRTLSADVLVVHTAGDSFTLLSMMDEGMVAAGSNGCTQRITQFLLIYITDKKNFSIN